MAEEFVALRRATIDGAPQPAPGARRGRFFESLETVTGLSTSVVIAVMSDHGEELFEREGVDHGTTLYDEALRVPLIVSAPGFPPQRVPGQVRLLDLAPTLLDLLGVSDTAFAAQAEGKSLRPLMEGRQDGPRDAIAETDFLFRISKRALRTADGRKLILDLETLRRELYDLKADPGEKRDLSSGDPEAAVALEKRLRAALGFKR